MTTKSKRCRSVLSALMRAGYGYLEDAFGVKAKPSDKIRFYKWRSPHTNIEYGCVHDFDQMRWFISRTKFSRNGNKVYPYRAYVLIWQEKDYSLNNTDTNKCFIVYRSSRKKNSQKYAFRSWFDIPSPDEMLCGGNFTNTSQKYADQWKYSLIGEIMHPSFYQPIDVKHANWRQPVLIYKSITRTERLCKTALITRNWSPQTLQQIKTNWTNFPLQLFLYCALLLHTLGLPIYIANHLSIEYVDSWSLKLHLSDKQYIDLLQQSLAPPISVKNRRKRRSRN